jgi:hypothetical protein
LRSYSRGYAEDFGEAAYKLALGAHFAAEAIEFRALALKFANSVHR